MLDQPAISEPVAAPGNVDAAKNSAPRPRRRWIVPAVLLALAFAFFIWVMAPIYLCNYLNKRGRELPDYTCHIGAIHLDLLLCGINLYDVSLVKKTGAIPVPFFNAPHIHVALQWREILHASFRSNITLDQPVVNFVQGPSKDQSQTFLEPEWIQEVKQLVPLRINQFVVNDGDIHYYEFDANPKIDLEMDQVQLNLDNLTNCSKVQSEFPSTLLLTGRPFQRGSLKLEMALNVDLKEPTFKEQLQLKEIPAPALNTFLAKYGSVYAKSGDLAFYSEMVSRHGGFNGYMKPFFQDLQFEPVPKDRNGLGALWAGLVNGLKDILENDQGAVATEVPVSGNYKDPDIDFWSAAFGIIQNAYFQALAQGFKTPQLAPVPDKTH